jgi:ribosome biogenesis GTPase
VEYRVFSTFSDSISLRKLGFDLYFQQAFSALNTQSSGDCGWQPARVIGEHRGGYTVSTGTQDRVARVSGRLRHESVSRVDLPAVGDWVAVSIDASAGDGPLIIQAVLPRRSAFVRGVAGGTTDPQIVGANIDVAVIVCALGQDLNARRIERYLAAVRASGARAVLALSKADIYPTPEVELERIRQAAGATPTHLISSLTGLGVGEIEALIGDDETVVLIGTSGAGKSSLANRLAGRELRATGGLGTDGRGQHTTTARELLVLDRYLVLDTPGMRELRLWEEAPETSSLDDTFAEIVDLAASCRFRDCAHDGEAGCAIAAALETGSLSVDRFESWQKLQRELAALERRKDARLAIDQKRQMKVRARANRVRDRGR